jgi:hypothetical protein
MLTPMLLRRSPSKKALRLARLLIELDTAARERKRPSALPLPRTTIYSR